MDDGINKARWKDHADNDIRKMRIVNRIEMDGGEQLGRHLFFLDRGTTEEEEIHNVNSSRMTVPWD